MGFRAGIDDALRALDRSEPADAGGRFIGKWDEALVEARGLGEGLVTLGEAGQARAVLESALDRLPRRERIRATIALARVSVLDGEPEEACQRLDEGLTAAVAEGFGLGTALIRRARVGFPRPWNGLACVQALDARLHARA